MLSVMVLSLFGTSWIVNTAETRTFLAGTFAAKNKETCVQSEVKKPDCGSKKVATWYNGQCRYKCQSAAKDLAYNGAPVSSGMTRCPAETTGAGWTLCNCNNTGGADPVNQGRGVSACNGTQTLGSVVVNGTTVSVTRGIGSSSCQYSYRTAPGQGGGGAIDNCVQFLADLRTGKIPKVVIDALPTPTVTSILTAPTITATAAATFTATPTIPAGCARNSFGFIFCPNVATVTPSVSVTPIRNPTPPIRTPTPVTTIINVDCETTNDGYTTCDIVTPTVTPSVSVTPPRTPEPLLSPGAIATICGQGRILGRALKSWSLYYEYQQNCIT